MFSGVGSSTFDTDIAALRSKLLIFCQADAKTTPVLRTEGFYIPKVRQKRFSFEPSTARFLFQEKRKWGVETSTRLRVQIPAPLKGPFL